MASLESMADGLRSRHQAESMRHVACPPHSVLARYPDEELRFPSILGLAVSQGVHFPSSDVNFEKRNFEPRSMSSNFSGTTVN